LLEEVPQFLLPLPLLEILCQALRLTLQLWVVVQFAAFDRLAEPLAERFALLLSE
jgi:hypothetical protein